MTLNLMTYVLASVDDETGLNVGQNGEDEIRINYVEVEEKKLKMITVYLQKKVLW